MSPLPHFQSLVLFLHSNISTVPEFTFLFHLHTSTEENIIINLVVNANGFSWNSHFSDIQITSLPASYFLWNTEFLHLKNSNPNTVGQNRVSS